MTMELERTELPPRIHDAITKIDVETGHLAQMVNELLDLSKIEQGEEPLRLEDVDLGVVVERAMERLRLYADRQAVSLNGEMPASAAERSVRGDEERLGQLLLNLLHNAIKFSPTGGEVVVRVEAEPDEIRLEVRDTGVGIPAQELDRIFERFYKVDRARQRGTGGTGLGLAIARHIAERHGGRIWAESEEGHGSSFVVALPRAQGAR
jgi:two-component system phosphate regulon sensor histidine kinase PhoR